MTREMEVAPNVAILTVALLIGTTVIREYSWKRSQGLINPFTRS
jgi:hypothetical protein